MFISAIKSRKIPGRLVSIETNDDISHYIDILMPIVIAENGKLIVKIKSDELYLQAKMIFDHVGDLNENQKFLCNELLPIIDYGDNKKLFDNLRFPWNIVHPKI